MRKYLKNPSISTIDNVLLIKRLKHNLLSIYRLWDKKYTINFDTIGCVIEHKTDKVTLFKGFRVENIYTLNLGDVSNSCIKCLVT